MNRLLLLPVMAMLLGAAGQNPGAAIVAHGAPGGIIPCRVCHGMQLQGNKAIGAPAVAGLPESTVLAAFSTIASGDKGDNIAMQHVARALSPAQRKTLAAYLASLPRRPVP